MSMQWRGGDYPERSNDVICQLLHSIIVEYILSIYHYTRQMISTLSGRASHHKISSTVELTTSSYNLQPMMHQQSYTYQARLG